MKKIYLLIIFTIGITSILAQNRTNSIITDTSNKFYKLKKLKEPVDQGILSKKEYLDKKKNTTQLTTINAPVEKTWLFRSTDNLATVIGYSLILVASVLTFIQWRKEQKWKRKEALMNRIASFNVTPGAWNARQMLVYADRDISLWDKEKPEDRYERVTRREVAVSLIPHEYLSIVYSPKESAIRDSFDDFLNRLSHLEVYREEGLLNKEEIKVVIPNWLVTLENLVSSSDLTDKALLRNFFLYISNKKMDKVIALLKTLDIPIECKIKEYQTILKEEIKQNKWQRLS